MLAGQGRIDSKRTKEANECDAQNITAILAVNQTLHQVPGEFDLRLLTETRPILRLNVDDYGSDALLDKLLTQRKIYPSYIAPTRRIPYFVTTVSSAVLHTSLRTRYRKASKAFEIAKEHFREISKSTWSILELNRAHEMAEQGNLGPDQLKNLKHLLSTSFGSWYLPFRTELARGALEFQSLDSIGTISSTAAVRETQQSWGRHSLSNLSTVRTASYWTKAFQIETNSSKTGEFNPCRFVKIKCDPTNETLLISRFWEREKLLTCEWELRVTLDDLVNEFNQALVRLQGFEGVFFAEYDVLPSSIGGGSTTLARSSHKRRNLGGLENAKSICSSDLVIDYTNSKETMFILPDRIGIDSELCDCTFDIPVTSNAVGAQVRCAVVSFDGLEKFVMPLIRHTHPWRWCPEIILHLTEQLSGNFR
jgi:hypothetical protein